MFAVELHFYPSLIIETKNNKAIKAIKGALVVAIRIPM